MHRSLLLSLCLAAPLPAVIVAAEAPAALSAAQVVEKNVAARGGLAAWRAVHALSWTGKMEAGGNNRPTLAAPAPHSKGAMPAPRPVEQFQLPFVMEMERPRKSRLELQFKGQTAIQVYDGTNGWIIRPFLNRHQVEPYTPDQLKTAAMQPDLDGPLIDYAAKGTTVALAGTETVEGHAAYKLKLTYKDQRVQNVWVDAKSFLELKIEGTPRRLDGRYHPVFVYMRDYRTVSGLQMPMVYETVVEGAKSSEKISIETAVVNPKLADSRFAKLE
jgi:hypothetical protein